MNTSPGRVVLSPGVDTSPHINPLWGTRLLEVRIEPSKSWNVAILTFALGVDADGHPRTRQLRCHHVTRLEFGDSGEDNWTMLDTNFIDLQFVKAERLWWLQMAFNADDQTLDLKAETLEILL